MIARYVVTGKLEGGERQVCIASDGRTVWDTPEEAGAFRDAIREQSPAWEDVVIELLDDECKRVYNL